MNCLSKLHVLSKLLIYYSISGMILFLGLVMAAMDLKAQDGKSLFEQNCAACHKMGSKLVGPDLTGVTEKRSEEWLIQFITSSQTMINNGDEEALAIYEEFNQMLMPDHTHLDESEIKSILNYIRVYTQDNKQDEMAAASKDVEETQTDTVEYSEGEIADGKKLFVGSTAFTNGGTSCIACHHVSDDEIIGGGRLAKDLTDVYGRMGEAGIRGILSSPPFPAMAQAYKNHKLTDEEITRLTAFLSYANEASDTQSAKAGNKIFFLGSSSGLAILLIIIAVLWKKRKKEAVNHNIFKRQLKSV